MVLREPMMVPERKIGGVHFSSTKFKVPCRESSSPKEESTIEFLCSRKLCLRKIGETTNTGAIQSRKICQCSLYLAQMVILME